VSVAASEFDRRLGSLYDAGVGSMLLYLSAQLQPERISFQMKRCRLVSDMSFVWDLG